MTGLGGTGLGGGRRSRQSRDTRESSVESRLERESGTQRDESRRPEPEERERDREVNCRVTAHARVAEKRDAGCSLAQDADPNHEERRQFTPIYICGLYIDELRCI